MSWLNANEYFVMETAVRDRVDDLRSTLDVVLAGADGEPGDDPPPDRRRAAPGAFEICATLPRPRPG
jgi:hypothetical protein